MTCAIIARADQGGIATQTYEMARHVRPYRILVVDLGGNGRGAFNARRFDGLAPHVHTVAGIPRNADWDWLFAGVDCVYTVECTYDDTMATRAAEAGVGLVIHANPELWKEAYRGATTRVYLPTRWEKRRIRNAQVLPMPIAGDRLNYRQRTEARRFLVPFAPAMLDRNGFRDVMAATKHLTRQLDLVIAPWPRNKTSRAGNTRAMYRRGTENYWDVYQDCDVLVLPRRYGGLSLSLQEAAGAGLAIVTLDTEPYRKNLHPAGLVPAIDPVTEQMKGGAFQVYRCRPKDLAATLVKLAETPGLVAEMSAHAGAWAASLDWKVWQPEWRRALEGVNARLRIL